MVGWIEVEVWCLDRALDSNTQDTSSTTACRRLLHVAHPPPPRWQSRPRRRRPAPALRLLFAVLPFAASTMLPMPPSAARRACLLYAQGRGKKGSAAMTHEGAVLLSAWQARGLAREAGRDVANAPACLKCSARWRVPSLGHRQRAAPATVMSHGG